jgi:phosphoribosylaminoimidazole-succinocarboxamide synthase
MTAAEWSELPGWRHLSSGKVRDLYAPSGVHPAGDVLLLVAADRVSAYDEVLPTPIPDKGAVLTKLTKWWFDRLSDLVPNHFVDAPVPDQVAGRAMVVRRLDMFPVECIARGYLAGSGLADYRATGAVCGIALPPGLTESSRLPTPIFTPSTKASQGDHDENVSFEQMVDVVGVDAANQLRDLTLAVYSRAERLAAERGIILADTKFEFGRDPVTGQIVLGDEVLTPDSSRFWDAATWQVGKPAPSFDKQYVRDWLSGSGWDRQGPPPQLPADVVAKTRERYLEAYRRLTGQELGVN